LLKSSFLDDDDKTKFSSIRRMTAKQSVVEMSLERLCFWLNKVFEKKVVILLDEYDTLLIEAMANDYYDKAIGFMQNFLSSTFKTNLNLHLGCITGVFRLAGESIYSTFNNAKIYTIKDEKFSQYFGFTNDEVKSMASYYGIPEKMDEIRQWYNGYVFGQTEIYNPWSIVSYFESNFDPKPYWVNTSKNTLIKEILRKADPKTIEALHSLMDEGTITHKIDDSITFRNMFQNPDALWTFLLSAGYLKIKSTEGKDSVLELPNFEIREMFNSLALELMTEAFGSLTIFKETVEALLAGDVVKFQDKFNQNIKNEFGPFNSQENFFHGYFLAMMALVRTKGGQRAYSNRYYGDGYADMAILPDINNQLGVGVVLEFKVARKNLKPLTVEKLAFSALEQIVEKRYDEAFLERVLKTKLIYGIAFQNKSCLALLIKNYDGEIHSGTGKTIKVDELKNCPKLVEKCLKGK
jgi:hypothetical protein